MTFWTTFTVQDRLQDSCFLRLFVVVASYRRGSGRGPRLQVRSKMILTTYAQHPQSVGRDSRDSRCTAVTRIPRDKKEIGSPGSARSKWIATAPSPLCKMQWWMYGVIYFCTHTRVHCIVIYAFMSNSF